MGTGCSLNGGQVKGHLWSRPTKVWTARGWVGGGFFCSLWVQPPSSFRSQRGGDSPLTINVTGDEVRKKSREDSPDPSLEWGYTSVTWDPQMRNPAVVRSWLFTRWPGHKLMCGLGSQVVRVQWSGNAGAQSGGWGAWGGVQETFSRLEAELQVEQVEALAVEISGSISHFLVRSESGV